MTRPHKSTSLSPPFERKREGEREGGTERTKEGRKEGRRKETRRGREGKEKKVYMQQIIYLLTKATHCIHS
jgi:hypothetical protein